MRRRRVIIVLAVCVLVGIGVVAFWPGEREPEYNGRKLGEWVDRVGNVWTSKETTAIRHIGTNAVPFLLKWINYTQPSWRERTFALYAKLPDRLQNRSVGKQILGVDEFVRQCGAITGFRILGADASGAVPDLYLLARNPRTSQAAIECLEGIGRAAVPALNRLTDEPNERIRSQAFNALSNIRNDAFGFPEPLPSEGIK